MSTTEALITDAHSSIIPMTNKQTNPNVYQLMNGEHAWYVTWQQKEIKVIHALTCMNLTNIMLSDIRGQSLKATYCVIPSGILPGISFHELSSRE